MKIALVYDRVNKWGGAERVLLALHELFPDAPLYTAVYDRESAPWAEVFGVRTSFLQKLPFAKKHHEWYPWLTPLAFESFNFDLFDVVISVTSADAKGIITKPHTKHICYCLTPTRYLWSHYDTYFPNGLRKLLTKPVISYLRKWDRVASTRPDYYIAISQTVKNRIKKYYDREAEIIYPPVRMPSTKHDVRSMNGRKDYFLVVSRLVRYKRVDIAIQACNELRLPLVIVGSGSDETRLRSLSGPTIQFIHNLTDEELAWYYQHSQALILPQEEDFGLVSVEAQSLGTPVIAYQIGGGTESVIQGKTGEFFYPQSNEALKKILKTFRRASYHSEDCKRNAGKFSMEQFKKHMQLAISTLLHP
ncbi:glycosyltransferase [Candidatus Roizmanbacteria bacterium]|nr:glycosyltransferase [Candidatus Roizmanbacteria bacterium]